SASGVLANCRSEPLVAESTHWPVLVLHPTKQVSPTTIGESIPDSTPPSRSGLRTLQTILNGQNVPPPGSGNWRDIKDWHIRLGTGQRHIRLGTGQRHIMLGTGQRHIMLGTGQRHIRLGTGPPGGAAGTGQQGEKRATGHQAEQRAPATKRSSGHQAIWQDSGL
ncbi:unnamed protein product, partial [Staurois parvus]